MRSLVEAEGSVETSVVCSEAQYERSGSEQEGFISGTQTEV